jgi:beta-glucosidase/6-phospho-beta-glucosidase/beta-galactosidase
MTNASAINQAGIDHYHKIIDALIAKNIEPVVTIFHFDLPQWLSDLGGATSPVFVDYFVAYADVVFNAFGSKVRIECEIYFFNPFHRLRFQVKKWITINEFYNYCLYGYDFVIWAPAIKSPGVGEYLCGHHLLLAHAKAYRLYQQKYFPRFGGQVGVTLEGPYYIPKDSSVTLSDHRRAMQYRYGWYADPIFGVDGGYPKVIIEEIDKASIAEGRPFSRLPKMSEDDKKLIKGSSDFFGMNYYTSAYITINKTAPGPQGDPSWFKDSGIKESLDPNWKRAKTQWLASVPQGLRDLLNWIKDEYNNPPVFITETGWNDDGEIEDDARIDYFNSHLKVVAKAIAEDKCNVIAYTAWSLMHSFEWNSGYSINFGLYNVNFSSPTLERIPKKSVGFFQGIVRDRAISRV